MNKLFEQIKDFDLRLLHYMNERWTSDPLDYLMVFLGEESNIYVPVILLILYAFTRGDDKDKWTVLFIAIAVGLSDLASSALKDLVGRGRPCAVLEGIRVLMGCGKSGSFPSGHATNIFSAMVLISARYRRFVPICIPFAALVAYSRVYVGVHYPSDIIFGAILGGTVGYLVAFLGERFSPSVMAGRKRS